MISAPSPSANQSIRDLLDSFSKGSSRQRRSLLKTLEARSDELAELGTNALALFDPHGDDWAAGWILQILNRHQPNSIKAILTNENEGWFSTSSSVGIDYGPFQKDLLCERFEEADRFTSATLRKLAGPNAVKRGYVYFSEVGNIPNLDLITLDRLWISYSQGKFGFSVQARILSALDGRFERLWPRIGWKKEGVWTRYPAAFTWTLDAPDGHMPLINQLRGVRLMDAILNHPFLKVRI